MSEAHRHFSAGCFNEVWELLDLPERTPEQERMMEHLAHASVYHWLQRDDGTAQNRSIGYWQLARVYAVLGEASRAAHYARVCIAVSEKGELAPFFVGYGYEAAARAAVVAGKDAGEFLAKARELAEQVEAGEGKAMLVADLDGVEKMRG